MAGDNLNRPSGGEVWRRLLSPDQVEEDVHQELRFHIDERVDELVQQGWSEADARSEVLKSFGDVDGIAKECIDVGLERVHRQRRTRMFTDAWTDLKYAFRTFRRHPLFTFVAVATLALGIGATTAVFTVVDRVALRALPFHEPDRLVAIWETNLQQGIATDNPSPANYADWLERTRAFEDIGAWMYISMTLTGRDSPEVLDVVETSSNLIEVLGVTPAIGRGFAPEDGQPDGPRPVILSYGAWERLWGGRDMIGDAIILDRNPHEVIGIMPAGFAMPSTDVDLWIASPLADPDIHRTARYLNVVGRLAPGVAPEAAEAELTSIHRDIAEEDPANRGWTVTLVDAKEQTIGDSGRVLWVVLAAVGLVLLIACVNVANLLLGRTAARRHELDVRAAIGASASRIRNQLMTESIAIGLAGGALGLAIAHRGLAAFLALSPSLPRTEEVGIDLRVLWVVFAISIGTALVFGVAPAAEAVRSRFSSRRSPGRMQRSERTRRLLVASEFGISLVLLVAAGTFFMSFRDMLAIDPGFDREGVVAAKVSLSDDGYPDDLTRVQYFEALLDQIEALPGVSTAAVTSTLPMDPTGTDFDLARQAEGHPDVAEGERQQTDYRVVSPGYIETMGLELMAGRDFSRFDRVDTPPVLIITQSFADALWPNENPLGKTIRIFYAEDKDWEVVGVVGDVRHRGLATPPSQQMFVPLAQAEFVFGYMTVVVKAATGAAVPVNAVREAAVRLDPNEPLFQVETVVNMIRASVARDRLVTTAVGALALLALLLASAGVYAVVSYQVSRRTREIGVKMAVGASRGRVVGEVLRDTLLIAGAGIAGGLVIAFLAARAGQGLVFGFSSFVPSVFIGVPLVLLLTALAAAMPPALRAAAIDPVEAIRAE